MGWIQLGGTYSTVRVLGAVKNVYKVTSRSLVTDEDNPTGSIPWGNNTPYHVNYSSDNAWFAYYGQSGQIILDSDLENFVPQNVLISGNYDVSGNVLLSELYKNDSGLINALTPLQYNNLLKIADSMILRGLTSLNDVENLRMLIDSYNNPLNDDFTLKSTGFYNEDNPIFQVKETWQKEDLTKLKLDYQALKDSGEATQEDLAYINDYILSPRGAFNVVPKLPTISKKDEANNSGGGSTGGDTGGGSTGGDTGGGSTGGDTGGGSTGGSTGGGTSGGNGTNTNPCANGCYRVYKRYSSTTLTAGVFYVCKTAENEKYLKSLPQYYSDGYNFYYSYVDAYGDCPDKINNQGEIIEGLVLKGTSGGTSGGGISGGGTSGGGDNPINDSSSSVPKVTEDDYKSGILGALSDITKALQEISKKMDSSDKYHSEALKPVDVDGVTFNSSIHAQNAKNALDVDLHRFQKAPISSEDINISWNASPRDAEARDKIITHYQKGVQGEFEQTISPQVIDSNGDLIRDLPSAITDGLKALFEGVKHSKLISESVA